jgi:hypothetical protein
MVTKSKKGKTWIYYVSNKPEGDYVEVEVATNKNARTAAIQFFHANKRMKNAYVIPDANSFEGREHFTRRGTIKGTSLLDVSASEPSPSRSKSRPRRGSKAAKAAKTHKTHKKNSSGKSVKRVANGKKQAKKLERGPDGRFLRA